MKILVVHDSYRQPGGEDRVVTAETALLRSRGHEVLEYRAHNDAVARMGRVALAATTVWSRRAHGDLLATMRRVRPDVAHVHNTLPLISPAVYHAARTADVPVVQTLHNYRLLCPGALLLRDGRTCEECLGRSVPLPAVRHACYRGSRAATAAVAAMLSIHRALGTWRRLVDLYVALTEFARQKFIASGFPAARIVVKPNFVEETPPVEERRGLHALFVGRLSPEKGVHLLLDAWRDPRLASRLPLKIVGDGPLAPTVDAAMRTTPGVEWLGAQPADVVTALMRRATLLVVPSLWYEPFGLVVVEAYAAGLPVVAADIGGLTSLVEHRRTGCHFRPGDAADLSAQLEWVLAHPGEWAEMGRAARAAFDERFTADRNYDMLVDIYTRASRR